MSAGGVPAEWLDGPGARADRVVLYLHGGGYVLGGVGSHRDMIARLSAASGARALGLNYRLAPEHPFPAAVDDAVAAYRWLLAQGIAPGRIAIAGRLGRRRARRRDLDRDSRPQARRCPRLASCSRRGSTSKAWASR